MTRVLIVVAAIALVVAAALVLPPLLGGVSALDLLNVIRGK